MVRTKDEGGRFDFGKNREEMALLRSLILSIKASRVLSVRVCNDAIISSFSEKIIISITRVMGSHRHF